VTARKSFVNLVTAGWKRCA